MTSAVLQRSLHSQYIYMTCADSLILHLSQAHPSDMLRYMAVLALALAACAQQSPQDVQILKYNNDVNIDGYAFDFETSDGTSRQESGQLQNAGSENAALEVQGEYSYQVDGKTYRVTFTAGQNGYQPKTSIV